jgi:group I intron endonuclease
MITQDIYVGKTIKTIEERMRQHIYKSRYGVDTHLYRAIRKYGEINFIIENLETVENYQLNLRECHHIESLKPRYNMTGGGDGGNTFIFITEDTRKKISESTKGEKNPMYGKRGKDNPNFGKKRGKNIKISKSLNNPCICEGNLFNSITDAENYYRGKYSVRKRLDSPKYEDWYRLVPKTRRK